LANARIIVKRRKSVRNIRKITRTMQLIATARFQAAFARATATKAYTEQLSGLVADLSAVLGEELRHSLMQPRPDVRRSALVVLTSGRGLCGGYNTSVLRLAIGQLDVEQGDGREVEVYMVGKKGISFFRFLRRAMHERITHIGDAPRFDAVKEIADGLMQRFLTGEVSAVNVAYMKFFSAGKQRPHLLQLLPLARESTEDASKPSTVTNVQYEFSPKPEELLEELLPASVRVRLFQCFIDAAVSEQTARMVAMKAATESAAEMITSLSRKYNRARQTQITMELLDIVGGANALA